MQPIFQCARFKSGAVFPVYVVYVQSLLFPSFDGSAGNSLGLVRGIVKHLNVKPVARIVKGADGIDDPVHHIHLVVGRYLNRNARQFVKSGLGGRYLFLVFVVQKNHQVTVKTVEAENGQDREIGNHDV